MGNISFTQVLRTNGNMSKVPAFTLLFHKVTFFVKATNLSVEVRIYFVSALHSAVQSPELPKYLG